jgi:uncharacterized protein (TIGR02246 family)
LFAALEAGDLERAMPILSPDVVFEIPSGEILAGRDAVRAALSAFLEDHIERVIWNLEVVASSAAFAEVRVCEVTAIWPSGEGEAFRVRGWHTGSLLRTEGRWQLERDVSTVDGPPEPVAESRPEGT